MPTTKIINADCREALGSFAPNSIDTIITDPPYGLSFMGQGWDHSVPGPLFWKCALRVAKPGAYLFSFGSTRLFHRLMCAIEDAGWELRDTMCWLYGTGFPKGLDISKAIDKEVGVNRYKLLRTEKHKATPGATEAKVTGYVRPSMLNPNHLIDSETTATPWSVPWKGYRPVLKPAWEPIVIAMKPVDKNFANNALTYGVAGLNIDGSKVLPEGSSGKESSGGRYPSNVLHDGSEEATKDFPPTCKSSGGTAPTTLGIGGASRKLGNTFTPCVGANSGGLGDTGTAARYFYCAKPSASERGEYNLHPTVKPLALMRYLCKLSRPPSGGNVLDLFCGSGTTGVAALLENRDFVGIERNPAYCEIIEKRIADARVKLNDVKEV